MATAESAPSLSLPPFHPEDELCSSLQISPDGASIFRVSTSQQSTCIPGNNSPNTSSNGVGDELKQPWQPKRKTHLPSQPRISLDDGPALLSYLSRELCTPDLDTFTPYLWLVAKQDSAHIPSLTEHLGPRGRHIVVTENPELHLVWARDVLYLKPMPRYLLSHAFWAFYFSPPKGSSSSPTLSDAEREQRDKIALSALGFLRSYYYLIRHKSDYALATADARTALVPKGISHARLAKFLLAFEKVTDDDVSPRWRFGHLRLTRLNLWARLALGRSEFQPVYYHSAGRFAQYYGPLLFAFAVLSVALGAMQVGLAVRDHDVDRGGVQEPWEAFGRMASVASVGTLCAVAGTVVFLSSSFMSVITSELMFALRDLYRRRRTWEEKQKAMCS